MTKMAKKLWGQKFNSNKINEKFTLRSKTHTNFLLAKTNAIKLCMLPQ